MKKETIAVDVDDVLAQENEAMRLFINDRYGLDLTHEDYLVEGEYWGYWESVWGVTKEEGSQRYSAFLDSDAKGNERTVDGAIEAIDHLKQYYDLAIVTSRPQEITDITHDWLMRHFPGVFNSVQFVAAWGLDKKVSKGIICKDIGASYLIDDNVEHCRLAAEEGIDALLFGNYGWSRGKPLPKGVRRMNSWHEIRDFFDAKA